MKDWNWEDQRTTYVPMPSGRINSKGSKPFDPTTFKKLVGALLFPAMQCRPDITYAVIHTSRHCQSPTDAAFKSAQNIARYLKGTARLGLVFDGNMTLLGSTPILWKSKKQTLVAKSSCESEFVSLAEAIPEGIYLKRLLEELGFPQSTIYAGIDNQSALKITQRPPLS
mmetsp:Transcript_41963/g.105851  ORF Transcript_41963/g.105851 Transcript_41963/m.105851 type:complete len:169 (-) Transcript_41963:174-680(-)